MACNYIFKKKGKKMSAVVEYALLFPWLLPTILICYSYRTFFNSDAVWYVGNQNLYFGQNVKLLIILAYTVVKLPFSLRMIKASFYAIDEELEDAARNLGSSGLRTFLQVKLPIILPSVLAVFALNFNALFTEYDMSATFQSPNGITYAMVIQGMLADASRGANDMSATFQSPNGITYAMVIQGMLADASRGANMNALGRRCASTVFIMIVSGLILYLVYGVGSRDLGERLEAKKRWRDRFDRLTGKRKKALKA